MDVNFISGRVEIDPRDTSTHSPEDKDEAATIEALKTEVQALKAEIQALKTENQTLEAKSQALETKSQALEERSKKDVDILRDFFNAVNIVKDRLARAENKIEGNDQKHFGAITSLRADLNRTDGHVLALEAGRDRLITCLIQLLNMPITP